MTTAKQENGIFINGKMQVIELLKNMDSKDKSRLLSNIKLKNPQLARELAEECLNFDSVWELNDQNLKTVLVQNNSAIIGLALARVDSQKQRRALSLLPRETAVKAFEIMQKDLSGNVTEMIRAKQKILESAVILHKQKMIQLY